MLVISDLEKSYSSQTLFEELSLTISPGERVGLVGKNGHGKSTLLKLILGQEEADSGKISYPSHYKISHLSQHLVFTESNILDEVCIALPLLDGSWKETYKAEAMLGSLGFSETDLEKPASSFSGGYQIRLNLAKLLLSEPNLLLLDEPTNYLDIVSIRWLKSFLREFEGEVLLITHDRRFMDSVTTHTAAIHRKKLWKAEGSTEKLYTFLMEEEELYEKTRAGEEKKRKQTEEYIMRFRAKASKAKSVQSKIKALEKQGVKEALADISKLDFKFSYTDFPGKWPLAANDVSFSYNKDTLLIPKLDLSVKKGDRIAVIGPNGKGKSTLLNLLAGELTPVTGSIELNTHTKVQYFGQTNINRLDLNRTVEDEVWSVKPDMSRSIVRSICGAMMFEGDTALKKIKVLSGGERSRVLLAKILLSPCNLLLLDEPTNHLDMDSIDALSNAIEIFPGTVIFVTHSEEFIEKLADKLVVFDNGKVDVFLGDYKEFLRKRGWSDENQTGQSNQATTATNTTSQEDKQKTRLIEKQISKQEKLIDKLKIKMAEASSSNDLDNLLENTKKFEIAEKELEELYESLVI